MNNSEISSTKSNSKLQRLLKLKHKKTNSEQIYLVEIQGQATFRNRIPMQKTFCRIKQLKQKISKQNRTLSKIDKSQKDKRNNRGQGNHRRNQTINEQYKQRLKQQSFIPISIKINGLFELGGLSSSCYSQSHNFQQKSIICGNTQHSTTIEGDKYSGINFTFEKLNLIKQQFRQIQQSFLKVKEKDTYNYPQHHN